MRSEYEHNDDAFACSPEHENAEVKKRARQIRNVNRSVVSPNSDCFSKRRKIQLFKLTSLECSPCITSVLYSIQ